MSIQPPPLATRFASLHATIAACPYRGWLPRSLHALILAALARVFGRLEQLLLLWQAGQLPTPKSRPPERREGPTLPSSPRQPKATGITRRAHTRHNATCHSAARAPFGLAAIPASNPSAAPSAAIKPGPHSRPAPIRAPAGRCPSPRQKRPIAGTPIRAYIVTISN